MGFDSKSAAEFKVNTPPEVIEKSLLSVPLSEKERESPSTSLAETVAIAVVPSFILIVSDRENVGASLTFTILIVMAFVVAVPSDT